MSLWTHLLLNYSPFALQFYGTALIQLIFFWGLSAIYTSLPFILPVFSARHKLQKQEKQPTLPELQDCLTVVARNQAISTLLQYISLHFQNLSKRPPPYRFDSTLPSIFELARDLVLATLLRELFFYYIHRLIHHPKLYPLIHKSHHRFTAPVALAAQYASATEHLFANILPITLPLMLVRSHIVTFWLFLASQLVQTTTVHSGYDFFSGWARLHDSHHESFTINFGILGLLDWVHGTSARTEVKVD